VRSRHWQRLFTYLKMRWVGYAPWSLEYSGHQFLISLVTVKRKTVRVRVHTCNLVLLFLHRRSAVCTDYPLIFSASSLSSRLVSCLEHPLRWNPAMQSPSQSEQWIRSVFRGGLFWPGEQYTNAVFVTVSTVSRLVPSTPTLTTVTLCTHSSEVSNKSPLSDSELCCY